MGDGVWLLALVCLIFRAFVAWVLCFVVDCFWALAGIFFFVFAFGWDWGVVLWVSGIWVVWLVLLVFLSLFLGDCLICFFLCWEVLVGVGPFGFFLGVFRFWVVVFVFCLCVVSCCSVMFGFCWFFGCCFVCVCSFFSWFVVLLLWLVECELVLFCCLCFCCCVMAADSGGCGVSVVGVHWLWCLVLCVCLICFVMIVSVLVFPLVGLFFFVCCCWGFVGLWFL